jgi:hypothetical protein
MTLTQITHEIQKEYRRLEMLFNTPNIDADFYFAEKSAAKAKIAKLKELRKQLTN